MSKINFYPGPSRVYSNITEYIYEAYKDGILGINHRSLEFMELQKKTKRLIKERLAIPDDYEVLFVSSATEAWEIIPQSLVRKRVQCFYNGAFGEKWQDYTMNLALEVVSTPFEINATLPVDKLDEKAEWIFITQNETSNGTMVAMDTLGELNAQKQGNQLIAVDATSSMAGIKLDFSLADIWFASVQKCFGLPAGMAVMVVSPAAIERSFDLGERGHYNSFLRIVENHRKNQTHHTPNVLLIYLLCRTMNISKGIDYIDDKIRKRYDAWKSVVDDVSALSWLVEDDDLRSRTVLALHYNHTGHLKKIANQSDIILGNGYGQWKDSSIRIANFPAIKSKEIDKLVRFLKRNLD